VTVQPMQDRRVTAATERFLGMLERNSVDEADITMLLAGLRFAEQAHNGQLRRSGEPYVTHPIEVATLALDIGATTPMLMAALLHDTVEDTPTTLDDVEARFGPEVRRLVDGCTKVARVHPDAADSRTQAANLRKLFVTLASDTRVIVIKLCDRLHNLRTIEHLPPEKARRIGEETLAIHAPLAHRLGLGAIKSELEDRAFAAADPDEHSAIRAATMDEDELHESLADAARDLERHLAGVGLTGSVSGRVKHAWSIKRKAERDNVDPRQLPDLLGLRVICETTDDCYRILAAVHDLWEPEPGRIKDYISRPKFNSYQSLHTTVRRGDGRLEVQVRTREMHHAAEHGSAAHYSYKHPTKRIEWLDRLLQWSDEHADDEDYLIGVMQELAGKIEILALTPKGRVVGLPQGATVVDFAYAVHTDIGNRCTGAKVNGRIAPLSRRLESGDVVEIATGQRSGPSQEWLAWVVTAKAKSKIRAATRVDKPATPAPVATRSVRAEKPRPTGTIVVPAAAGLHGVETRLAGCCSPAPGQPVEGIAARGGLIVHRSECPVVERTREQTPGRLLDVYWVEQGHHVDTILIQAEARAGLLAELAAAVTSSGGRLIQTQEREGQLALSVETSGRTRPRIRNAIALVDGTRVVK